MTTPETTPATAVFVDDAKTLARLTVRFLVSQVGHELVSGVWAIMTGQVGLLGTDLDGILTDLLSTVREQLTDAELAAEIVAANTAVDLAVDAEEAARLAGLAGKVPA